MQADSTAKQLDSQGLLGDTDRLALRLLERPSGIESWLDQNPNVSSARISSIRRSAFDVAWMADWWGVSGSVCGGAVATKAVVNGVKVVPLLCGKWSCPICGRLRYRWFVRNVERAADGFDRCRFLTLTITHDFTVAESWDRIMWAWNRFRGRVKEQYGDFEYVWVIEAQQSGHAHLHVLMNTYLPKLWLDEQWAWAVGRECITHVEEIERAAGARYLAKYLGKQAGLDLSKVAGVDLTGRRRWSRSRGIAFEPYKKPSEGWRVDMMPYKEYLSSLLRWDEVVERHDLGVPYFVFRPFGLGPLAGIPDRFELFLESFADREGDDP